MPRIYRKKKAAAKNMTAKPNKRRSALKDALRRRERRHAMHVQTASDIEDLLIGMAAGSNSLPTNGTDIENLLYSTTASTAELGYNSGFSVGKAIALRTDGKGSMADMLDMMGMHDSLYHPFKDKVIITSRPQRLPAMQVNKNIHVYLAGIISGYLSHAANMMVNTAERRCVYNRSDSCQFVSEPMSGRPIHYGIGVERATDAIARSLNVHEFSMQGREYLRVLAYLPLMRGGLGRQVLRMMVISGKKLGAMSGALHTARAVSSVANYFGAREHSIEKRGRKTLIRLRYESYNSMQDFVSVGAALITGFAESTGRSASVSFTTNRDKSYTAVIETGRI